MDIYTYLTEDVLNQFQDTGTENLIQVIDSGDANATAMIFTELLMVFEDGNLPQDSIFQFLSQAIKQETTAEIFCSVLNVFPLSTPVKELITNLVQQSKVIKISTLSRTIKFDTLLSLGLIPESSNRQLAGRKRDEYYTQKKFNLVHEEVEGFCRLIAEVNGVLRSENSEFQVEFAIKMVQSLMGHYGLDPNKVFDVLVDIFANNFVGNQTFVIDFFKKSPWWPQKPASNASMLSLHEGGDHELSKLVGFKLARYGEDKVLPETLKLLVSVLIKEGLLNFAVVYKFLLGDEAMPKLEQLYKKKLDDEVFQSTASALALAAPLLDDDDDSTTTKTSTKAQEAVEQPLDVQINGNMKFQMLRSFLSIGLYWPSIYILTEYPFMAKIDAETRELMFRLTHHMISPLYNQLSSLDSNDLSHLSTSKKLLHSRGGNEVYGKDFEQTTLLSFKATIQSFSQKKFIFFYDAWTQGLPVITTIDDLFRIHREFLKFVDVYIAKDVSLYAKICDIGANSLINAEDTVKDQWYVYYRNYIFPAISMVEENTLIVDKAFKILSFYPKETRFNLYSELHQVLSKSNPLIKIAYGKAEKSTKNVLKRLSKETVRPMMRRIAKISYSNPLPCFLTVLQQIESYDNLNTLVVETARYFNDYGWDVLTLAIMIRLTAPGRSNVQESGLFERQWIQSLASFIGKICQRYPNAIDIATLLDFLLKSFHANDTAGLIVLKEMLMAMGGIQAISNLALDQIYKLNSGDSIRKLVFHTINDTRFDRVKSGKVLVKNLLDLDCVNELLVLLCQVNDASDYVEDSHLKILTNRKDDITNVIQLYVELISFFSDGDQPHLMALPQLVSQYKVPIEWGFQIWRRYLPKTEMSEISQLAPSDLSGDLFTSFWKLGLYDINYQESFYEEAAKKAKDTVNSLRTESKSKKYKPVHVLDKLHDDLVAAETMESNISEDKKVHYEHHQEVFKLFTASNWFNDNEGKFLEACILPRSIHSSFDAVYSAKFLVTLVNSNVTGFSLFKILDILINGSIVGGTIFTSTPLEAENFGLFFAELLTTLSSWTHDYNDNLGIGFSEFKTKVYNYHQCILEKLTKNLESVDYMSRRNSITFLKNIIGLYPVVEDQCEVLASLITNIIDTETRDDLKLAASALVGHLKSRSKSWLPLWEFIDMDEEALEKHKAGRDEKKRVEAEKKAKEEEERKKVEKEKEDKERLKQTLDYYSNVVGARGSRDTGSKNRYDKYSEYQDRESSETPDVGDEVEDKVEDMEVDAGEEPEVEVEADVEGDIETEGDAVVDEAADTAEVPEVPESVEPAELNEPQEDAEPQSETEPEVTPQPQEEQEEQKDPEQEEQIEPEQIEPVQEKQPEPVEKPAPESSIKRGGPLKPQASTTGRKFYDSNYYGQNTNYRGYNGNYNRNPGPRNNGARSRPSGPSNPPPGPAPSGPRSAPRGPPRGPSAPSRPPSGPNSRPTTPSGPRAPAGPKAPSGPKAPASRAPAGPRNPPPRTFDRSQPKSRGPPPPPPPGGPTKRKNPTDNSNDAKRRRY
ncbi:THO complex subunit 2 [[Candida] jaroonii]|uniref:THO complex subunit 2 n=1 Tax=[Candida] jaroonii TaxID=467808 RepID=A0ACA9YFW1_9ASCO|nr:THO complex subunit 2 [[Candida] jaroonii]